ncbi:MAG: hypothetical protein WCH42_03590 [Actinomycetes bacterium]
MTKSIFLVIIVALILAWYLSFSATRLDRLHHRVETSWEHLDALLQRRAAIALDIAHKSNLDPATYLLLASSAFQAREATIIERSEAESSLSESLRLLQSDSQDVTGTIALSSLAELESITDKIKMSINIHLEAVNAVRNLRSKVVFRVFRLAGHAPLPVHYAFEDDVL